LPGPSTLSFGRHPRKARLLPEGQKKTDILNDLVAKYEGHRSFNPVNPETEGYRACRVIEILIERMTEKAELAQSLPQQGYRDLIARRLAERGWPGDREAMQRMEKVGSAQRPDRNTFSPVGSR